MRKNIRFIFYEVKTGEILPCKVNRRNFSLATLPEHLLYPLSINCLSSSIRYFWGVWLEFVNFFHSDPTLDHNLSLTPSDYKESLRKYFRHIMSLFSNLYHILKIYLSIFNAVVVNRRIEAYNATSNHFQNFHFKYAICF